MATGDEIGRRAEQPRGEGPAQGNPFQLFSNLISAAAGVIGLLYIVGVAVIAGRLLIYRLPSESVVSQLPQQYLLAVGLSEVILPTLVFPIAYMLLAWIAHGGTLLSTEDVAARTIGGHVGAEPKLWRISGSAHGRRFEATIPRWLDIPQGVAHVVQRISWIGWSGALAFLLLFVTFHVCVSVGLAVNPFSRFWPTIPFPSVWLIMGLLTLSVVFVLAMGGAFYSDLYSVLPSGKRVGATLGMVAAVGLAAFIVWGINAISTPLDYAKVCAKTSSHKGILVASTSDTIYIGEYPSPQSSLGNLGAYSKSDVTTTVTGVEPSPVYAFPCPNPSGTP